MIAYILVVSGIVLTAAAQCFLKLAGMQDGHGGRWFFLIVISVILYALSFGAYAIILQHFPISRIAPIMTVGTVVLVVIIGAVLGESLTYLNIFGITLGVAGILLLLT